MIEIFGEKIHWDMKWNGSDAFVFAVNEELFDMLIKKKKMLATNLDSESTIECTLINNLFIKSNPWYIDNNNNKIYLFFIYNTCIKFRLYLEEVSDTDLTFAY